MQLVVTFATAILLAIVITLFEPITLDASVRGQATAVPCAVEHLSLV